MGREHGVARDPWAHGEPVAERVVDCKSSVLRKAVGVGLPHITCRERERTQIDLVCCTHYFLGKFLKFVKQT